MFISFCATGLGLGGIGIFTVPVKFQSRCLASPGASMDIMTEVKTLTEEAKKRKGVTEEEATRQESIWD